MKRFLGIFSTLFPPIAMVAAAAGALAQPEPTATPVTVCFSVDPASARAGDSVVVAGDCPGLLHHRFIRIYFDGELVREWDFGGGTEFLATISVPATACPGSHVIRVQGPFLDTSTDFEVVGAPAPCSGDCNLDQRVTVGELVTATSIALGRKVVTDCAAADGDGDQQVSIAELVSAVESALRGCRNTASCAGEP